MGRIRGQKHKKTVARESERRQIAAIVEGRVKVKSAKGEVDPSLAVDSLNILEEVMRHFYFKARILEGLGEKADWKQVDSAMAEAGRWAKEVATFRHARIAAMKIIGDPNEAKIGDQTIEQLRRGIMEDLLRLADVIDLKALPNPQGIENFAPGQPNGNGEAADE